MALFSIKNGKLEPIKSKSFALEKEIQKFTETNLSIVFGLQYVVSEFRVKGFRFHKFISSFY
jgi:hypothetical protein